MYTTEEMRNPGQYRCARCYISCPTKQVFKDHSVVCKFIHASRHENSIDNYYSQMEVPSQKAQFQYIIELTKKIDELEQKMAKMQKSIIPLCRRQVSEYLESLSPPKETFTEWCQSIQITDEILENVLKTDLKTGTKAVLENLVNDQDIPIRAFTQKSNIFYLYDNDEWRTMTAAEFTKLVKIIENKFPKKYDLWTKAHYDDLHDTPQAEERALMYMAKVNGFKQGTIESRISEIKGWLFKKMAVSLKQIVV